MQKTTGIIKSVSNKEGKYGINIDDTWYNGWGVAPANKGDNVEVEFEINGDFNNVRMVKVLNKSTFSGSKKSEFDVSSVLVSYAKDLVIAGINKDTDISEAMKLATHAIFESYLEIKGLSKQYEMQRLQTEQETNQA